MKKKELKVALKQAKHDLTQSDEALRAQLRETAIRGEQVNALLAMLGKFGASLALLWILAQLMTEPWFYAGLNVATPSTAMALVLFFVIAPSFSFLTQPLFAAYSRKHEFEADRYATEHASARDLVTALVKLYKDNAATLTPDPLHSAFYDSHPPALQRIERLQQTTA